MLDAESIKISDGNEERNEQSKCFMSNWEHHRKGRKFRVFFNLQSKYLSVLKVSHVGHCECNPEHHVEEHHLPTALKVHRHFMSTAFAVAIMDPNFMKNDRKNH